MRFSIRFILFAVMPYVIVLSLTWSTMSLPFSRSDPPRGVPLVRVAACIVFTIVWTYVVAYWCAISNWLKQRKRRRQDENKLVVSDP